MPDVLPLALLAFSVILVALMPWRRPHPNHQFILDLLPLLGDEQECAHESPPFHDFDEPTTESNQR